MFEYFFYIEAVNRNVCQREGKIVCSVYGHKTCMQHGGEERCLKVLTNYRVRETEVAGIIYGFLQEE